MPMENKMSSPDIKMKEGAQSVSQNPALSDGGGFEMIFLNPAYKYKEYRSYVHQQNLAPKPTIGNLHGRTRPTLRKIVSGIKMVISAPLFENENTKDPLFLPLRNEFPFTPVYISWTDSFQGTLLKPGNTDQKTFSQVIATIDTLEDLNHIYFLMSQGISVFMINLFFGSPEVNATIMHHLNQCSSFRSHSSDTPFTCSIMAKISPRKTKIGKLKGDELELYRNDIVIVTAKRNYSKTGTRHIIYANILLQLIDKLNKDANFRIGCVKLLILERHDFCLKCIVLEGGKIKSFQQVQFTDNYTYDQITTEELQDITFTKEVNINTIMLPEAGNNAYYNSIKNALNDYEVGHYRIFVRVKQDALQTMEYANWIADTYDGIVIKYSSNPLAREVLDFTEQTKYLMEICYEKKKPIILGGFFPDIMPEGAIITASKKNHPYLFFYPDKFCLSCSHLSNRHLAAAQALYEDVVARIKTFAIEKLNKPFVDFSTTGSDTVARSIVAASYDMGASAIILCSVSGRMAEKIAHFRPKCPIILLTKDPTVVRYIKILYNVWVAFFSESGPEDEMMVDRDRDTITAPCLNQEQYRRRMTGKKLLFGLLYGVSSGLLRNNDNIIYGFRSDSNLAYPNKYVAFTLDINVIDDIYKSDV